MRRILSAVVLIAILGLTIWTLPVWATAAVASITFTQVASCPRASDEYFVKFESWKDAGGSPALLMQTTKRILFYNPIGGTLEDFVNFDEENTGTSSLIYGIDMLHFRSTGDLYAAQGQHNDYLMRYSPGAGYGKVGPNRGGGLDVSRQGSPRVIAQNAYGIGVWTAPTSVVGSGNGGAWFVTPEGGWHCLNRDLAGTNAVWGGGIGNRRFFTVFETGLVEWQDLPNVGAHPQFALGKKYDTTAGQTHEYSESDGGTSLIRSTLHGFTVDCLKSDGTDLPGLDPNASFVVQYNLDGTGWTNATQYRDTAGTLRTAASGIFTAATTNIGFPVRIVLNNEFGLSCYRFSWRITPATSDEDETPVIVTCAPRLTKVPPPHYNYEFVTDLSAFQRQGGLGGGGILPMPNGRSAAALHAGLEALDQLGTMVKITYGVGGELRSDFCEFAMAPQLHPQAGVGRYRISLRSVRHDPSG